MIISIWEEDYLRKSIASIETGRSIGDANATENTRIKKPRDCRTKAFSYLWSHTLDPIK